MVSDYTQAKDPIFARALLNEREVELYERLTMGLHASAPRPDLTVYVDARNDVLLERIRKRNRPYEASINAAYLNSLREAYSHHHDTIGRLQILSIDTSDLNLQSETELEELYGRILAAAAPDSPEMTHARPKHRVSAFQQ